MQVIGAPCSRWRRGKKFLKGGVVARRATAPIRRTLEGPATAGLGSLPTCGCDDTVNEAEAEGVMAMARLSKSSFGIPLEKDAEEVATVAAPA